MACKMCKAIGHTTEQHQSRATLARLKSKKWRACLSSKAKREYMREWWVSHRDEMASVRKLQVTEEWRIANGERMKRQWADPVWRNKMCRIRKHQSRGNQGRVPCVFKYRALYIGMCGNLWMRSSWEVAMAQCLDSLSIQWEYEKHKFNVSKGHYYTPDFYLPKKSLFIEVKGWRNARQEKNIRLLRKKFPETKLLVLFGKELKAAGVLGERKPELLMSIIKKAA